MKTVARLAGVLLLAGLTARPAAATTIFYSTRATFDAAVTGEIVDGFNGILAPGQGFAGFNPLVIEAGITFSSPTALVNVTNQDFYAPTFSYPSDFIVNSVNPGPNNTLNIALPSPVTAFAIDFGSLFAAATGSLTFSNGFAATIVGTPHSGSTFFLGMTTTDPLVSVQLTMNNENWVVTRCDPRHPRHCRCSRARDADPHRARIGGRG